MPPPVVLYVEDEEDDVLFMSLAFKKLSGAARLESARDGRAAIDYLQGAPPYDDRDRHPLPTVILLDLNLPLVSGFDVLKWIRQQAALSTVPVVIFSSSGRLEDRERALDLRADDYLLKPVSGLEFREVVRGFLARWLSAAR
jgi:CheY-like chemotaxis protein